MITDVTGEYFRIKKKVKQGDPLSPALFNCALEEVFKNLKTEWETKGININGQNITNLRFADDIVLFACSKEEVVEMIKELVDHFGREAGLTMNTKKKQKL